MVCSLPRIGMRRSLLFHIFCQRLWQNLQSIDFYIKYEKYPGILQRFKSPPVFLYRETAMWWRFGYQSGYARFIFRFDIIYIWAKTQQFFAYIRLKQLNYWTSAQLLSIIWHIFPHLVNSFFYLIIKFFITDFPNPTTLFSASNKRIQTGIRLFRRVIQTHTDEITA